MAQATDTEIRDLLLGLDKKLDVHIAKTEEQLKSIEIQISDLKKNTDTQLTDIRLQLRSQDNRLWTFVAGIFMAGLGVIAKFAFFSGSN